MVLFSYKVAGVIMYIHKIWPNNALQFDTYCMLDQIEVLMLSFKVI